MARRLSHAERLAALALYFKVGNIVPSYGGNLDLVLGFHAKGQDASEGWAVEVIACDRHGNNVRGERPRVHATPPSDDMLRRTLLAAGAFVVTNPEFRLSTRGRAELESRGWKPGQKMIQDLPFVTPEEEKV